MPGCRNRPKRVVGVRRSSGHLCGRCQPRPFLRSVSATSRRTSWARRAKLRRRSAGGAQGCCGRLQWCCNTIPTGQRCNRGTRPGSIRQTMDWRTKMSSPTCCGYGCANSVRSSGARVRWLTRSRRNGHCRPPRRTDSRAWRITCRSSCRSVPSRVWLARAARRPGRQLVADVRPLHTTARFLNNHSPERQKDTAPHTPASKRRGGIR